MKVTVNVLVLYVIAVFIFSTSIPSEAQLIRYSTLLTAHPWKLIHGHYDCVLKQKIPGYGFVFFKQMHSGKLTFEIRAHSNLYEGEIRKVSVVASSWQDSGRREGLALGRGTRNLPVSFGGGVSRIVMLGLRAGKTIEMTYHAGYHTKILVRLSPIYFSSSLDKLESCATQLPKVRFSQFAHSTLYFKNDSDSLDASSRNRLKQISRYIHAFHNVSRIGATGYTDWYGSAKFNLRLGLQRAQAVADYLKKQGIKIPIHVVSGGSEHPVGSNWTAKGRARNRRVELVLKKK